MREDPEAQWKDSLSESSRPSPFWTRSAGVRHWAGLPKDHTHCWVCAACLGFTLKRKEHHNGKLQMSSRKHAREAYKPDSSTFCPSTPQQAWWLDLHVSFYYLAHLTFQPLWAFCVMYGPFSLLLNCFLYPSICFISFSCCCLRFSFENESVCYGRQREREMKT